MIHIFNDTKNICEMKNRLQGGGKGRMIQEVKLRHYYKHIGKYHNVSPCTTIIFYKNIKK
jgi:hypothetical protein